MFLNNKFDTATPVEGAIDGYNKVANSFLVTAGDMKHVNIFDNFCALVIIQDYLEDPREAASTWDLYDCPSFDTNIFLPDFQPAATSPFFSTARRQLRERDYESVFTTAKNFVAEHSDTIDMVRKEMVSGGDDSILEKILHRYESRRRRRG